jgi:hypothetical protein
MEPKLELNRGGVAGVAEKGCLCNGAAGAAGKGRYVGVPTYFLLYNKILLYCCSENMNIHDV